LATNVSALVALSSLFLLVPACGSSAEKGACSYNKGSYIGPDTGYVFVDDHNDCAEQTACDAFCAAVANRDDYRGCKFSTGGFCSGTLGPPPDANICAISLTVTCGGGSGSTTTNCFGCDVVTPNQSDYDPSTDCTSQWGAKVGHGASCDAAMKDLASQ
jgi:hypothetical protein